MAEAATKRYKRKIKVHVFYDESENAKTAYTDNEIISINAGNSVTRSFPTKVLRSDSLIGMNAHEIGHILFTDFPMMKHYCQEMSRGRMYPAVPSFSEWEIEEKAKEVQEFLENADELTRQAIATVSQFLFNVLEDGYIEARMCDAFPGKYATGIRLNNIRISEMAQSITTVVVTSITEMDMTVKSWICFMMFYLYSKMHYMMMIQKSDMKQSIRS